MELKLNIYDDDDNIVKTYERDSFKLKFGVVEDLINTLNLEGLETENNVEFIKVAFQVVTGSFETIKPLLKRIFKGITDEELKNTDISEIVSILVDIVKFSMGQINKGSNGKN